MLVPGTPESDTVGPEEVTWQAVTCRQSGKRAEFRTATSGGAMVFYCQNTTIHLGMH